MMKKIFLFILGSFLVSQLALADSSLYQATVTVPSQSQSDLQAGISQAFAQVLVKISGDDNVLEARKIKPQLGQAAATYVQSYSYVTNTNPNNPTTTNTTATNTNNSIILQVQFYPKAVNELLQDAGIKFWARQQRPQTLLWIATQTTQGKTIISNNSANTIATALQTSANNRGLPILFPMMDLQDMQNVGVNDIWQLEQQGVLNAAKRYGTQSILEGKIYLGSDQQWYAQWVLLINGQSIAGQTQGNNVNQVIATMMNKVADNVAAKDAKPTAVSAQQVTLRINNVNGLDDYADIEKYLRSLPIVSDVQVANVDPNDLVINVTVSGGTTALTTALNAGTQLQILPASLDGDNVLNYRWNSSVNNTNNNNQPTISTAATTDLNGAALPDNGVNP